ncbi:DNA primase [Cellulosilyticum sp. I15G10I2]|uniref:DNA primase n=1 Tax=Cellulosilyticum sp. I15G10I2 TaxID=1892843 RepID=UPI00085CCEDD|nr:DNA primase [Cellulosilyticum sp. I15G10I2]
MYYPEHIIETIRERSDIVALISEYTTLTKKGNSYTGLCPFHNEKTPSFSVSEEKQLYYCFGCGAGGNTVTFLMQKENMTFPEAIKYLAERENIELDELALSQDEIQKNQKRQRLLNVIKEAAKFFYFSLRDTKNEEIMHYLIERNVSIEMIKQFGLGYSPSDYNILYKYLQEKGYDDDTLMESGLFLKSKKGGFIYDRFASRLIFPIFDVSKKVIAFGGRVTDGSMPKYLNSPENILFNKSYTLYGLNFAKATSSNYYILVEGYMDVIAMHQAGFTQTIASLGTAFTSSHAKLLKRYTKEVVIMYDSDSAGINATLRAIPILRNEGIKVRVLQLKSGKDPDEYLKKYGKEHLMELIKGAKADIWFEISRFELKYDLKIPEQKVMFLQEVAGRLSEIPSTIEQAIYIDEICDTYQIESSAFKAEVNNNYKKIKHIYSTKDSQAHPKGNRQAVSTEVIFLSTIYHYPHIVKQVKQYITPDMFEGDLLKDLAKEIFKAAAEHNEINMMYFTARYPESTEQNIISHIMMHKDERYEEQTILHKMVLENIKRLKGNYLGKKMNETKDAIEKQNLLFQKKALDKLYIDFING